MRSAKRAGGVGRNTPSRHEDGRQVVLRAAAPLGDEVGEVLNEGFGGGVAPCQLARAESRFQRQPEVGDAGGDLDVVGLRGAEQVAGQVADDVDRQRRRPLETKSTGPGACSRNRAVRSAAIRARPSATPPPAGP